MTETFDLFLILVFFNCLSSSYNYNQCFDSRKDCSTWTDDILKGAGSRRMEVAQGRLLWHSMGRRPAVDFYIQAGDDFYAVHMFLQWSDIRYQMWTELKDP